MTTTPEATLMSLTITDTTMTSDHRIHTARHSADRNGWEVSWLPGQILDRNSAITAMTLADAVSSGDMDAGNRLWPHVQEWAYELGLTAPDAVALASWSPGCVSTQQDPRPADREAAG